MTKPALRRSTRTASAVQNKRKHTGNDVECYPDQIVSSVTSNNAVGTEEMIVPDLPMSSASPMKVTSSVKRIKAEESSASKSIAKVTPNKSMLNQSDGIKDVKNVSSKTHRPTPQECEYAVKTLGSLHPSVLESTNEIKNRRNSGASSTVKSEFTVKTEVNKDDANDTTFQASSCGKQESILDGVISTMLSQNTTSANSTRAFANLKKAIPDWNTVPKLKTTTKIETAIKVAGLAKTRAERIMAMCQTLQNERGVVSLEYLRNSTTQEIKDDLLRHKGLGIKTISCVLMFTLGREDEFPVDTHVLRISQQHGWVPKSFDRNTAYEYLNEVVPDHLKLDLHCLLVQHGRECHRCAARGKPQFPPKDGSKIDCPLVHLNSIASSSNTPFLTSSSMKDIKVETKIKCEV